MNRYDREHLRLLSIFHYVAGGLAFLVGCLPFIHLGLGIAMLTGALDGRNPPPRFVGILFVVIAAAAIVLLWALAGGMVVLGRSLTSCRHYRFCQVMAGIECLWIPFGTVLGAFTLIVLFRPAVATAFTGRPMRAMAEEFEDDDDHHETPPPKPSGREAAP
jgi:hypothetical protein